MDARNSIEKRLEQVIALLQSIRLQGEYGEQHLTAWQEHYMPAALTSGRISATDRLSWWFRPATASGSPWDDYFDQSALSLEGGPEEALLYPIVRVSDQTATATQPTQSGSDEPAGPWLSLRLLLAEPEEELFDEDAESVVTCLYDFIHAIGRRDVEQAMLCVAPDYHTLEDDKEIDRLGLRHHIKNLLDSLLGWEFEISLVEVPRPILHPDAILVYAEMQIDAHNQQDAARKTILERRIAVFNRQPNGDWLISALSPV